MNIFMIPCKFVGASHHNGHACMATKQTWSSEVLYTSRYDVAGSKLLQASDCWVSYEFVKEVYYNFVYDTGDWFVMAQILIFNILARS
jgi:hypothetical protein